MIPNIKFAQQLFHKILVYLKYNELRVITRLLTGHVKLKSYMYSINLSNHPYCVYCYNNNDNDNIYCEETIEHYLLQCNHFIKERNELFSNINNELKPDNSYDINVQLLLTGYPCENWEKRKNIIKHTISFINDTNRIKI